MFKERRTLKVTCIAILFCVVLVSQMAFGWPLSLWPKTFKYLLKDNPPLTEKLAIELTKRSMQKTLKKGQKLQLLPHRHDKDKNPIKYFARNRINPNEGYVTWRIAQGEKSIYYGVRVEKKGNTFYCKIFRRK